MVWVRSKVSLARLANETPSHVIAVTEDITESRPSKEKLRQSDTMLDTEREKSQEPILDLNAGPEGWVLKPTAELDRANKAQEAFSESVSPDRGRIRAGAKERWGP